MGLTLVTATLPSRTKLLAEMLASVAAQTRLPDAHVLRWDHGAGFIDTVNAAVESVTTDYFCLVDDDDLLLPEHVATLTGNLDADIVWSWCRVEGRTGWDPNSGWQPGQLAHRNFIPSNMAMRTGLWRDLGGYRRVGPGDHPDWELLRRAEASGATFLNIPTVTWVYRFHGANMSLGGGHVGTHPR